MRVRIHVYTYICISVRFVQLFVQSSSLLPRLLSSREHEKEKKDDGRKICSRNCERVRLPGNHREPSFQFWQRGELQRLVYIYIYTHTFEFVNFQTISEVLKWRSLPFLRGGISRSIIIIIIGRLVARPFAPRKSQLSLD